MEDRYLGDGVYASFDGYQIWLAANNHNNKLVALEPEVMENLIKYYNDSQNDNKFYTKNEIISFARESIDIYTQGSPNPEYDKDFEDICNNLL